MRFTVFFTKDRQVLSPAISEFCDIGIEIGRSDKLFRVRRQARTPRVVSLTSNLRAYRFGVILRGVHDLNFFPTSKESTGR